MTRKEKLIKKLKRSPTSLSYSEIESTLISLGFVKVEAKGSHKKFKHSSLSCDFIVPVHNNDCKDFYKKLISKLIKKYF